jgi:hypothetical protein
MRLLLYGILGGLMLLGSIDLRIEAADGSIWRYLGGFGIVAGALLLGRYSTLAWCSCPHRRDNR